MGIFNFRKKERNIERTILRMKKKLKPDEAEKFLLSSDDPGYAFRLLLQYRRVELSADILDIVRRHLDWSYEHLYKYLLQDLDEDVLCDPKNNDILEKIIVSVDEDFYGRDKLFVNPKLVERLIYPTKGNIIKYVDVKTLENNLHLIDNALDAGLNSLREGFSYVDKEILKSKVIIRRLIEKKATLCLGSISGDFYKSNPDILDDMINHGIIIKTDDAQIIERYIELGKPDIINDFYKIEEHPELIRKAIEKGYKSSAADHLFTLDYGSRVMNIILSSSSLSRRYVEINCEKHHDKLIENIILRIAKKESLGGNEFQTFKFFLQNGNVDSLSGLLTTNIMFSKDTIKLLIEVGCPNIINYLQRQQIDEEVINKAIDKGFSISEIVSADLFMYLNEHPELVLKSIKKGNGNAFLCFKDNAEYLTKENFELALQNGLYFEKLCMHFRSYDDIKLAYIEEMLIKNPKYVIKFVSNGGINGLNYLLEGSSLNEDEKQELNELIFMAIDNGYKMNSSSPSYLGQFKYVRYSVEKGQRNAINNLDISSINDVEKQELDELVFKCIDGGYKIDSTSPNYLKQFKYIKYAVEKGQISAINYLDISSVNDTENQELDDVIRKAIDSGYEFVASLSYEIKKRIFKQFLICGKFISLKASGMNAEDLFKDFDLSDSEIGVIINNIVNNSNYDISLLNIYMFILKKYSLSGINDNKLNEYYAYILSSIKNSMNEKFKDEANVNMYISKVMSMESLNPLNFEFILNKKDLRFVATYNCDLKSTMASENNSGITNEILDKGNVKQIKKIIDLLKGIGISEEFIPLLAINIYMSLDFNRAADLLSGKYGDIDQDKLIQIFKNIIPSNVLFIKDGNGFKPQINEQLINLVFGANYNISNTLIKNFLNDCHDKKNEINQLKEKIKSDMSLTADEKQEKISIIDEQMMKYTNDIKEFFVNFSSVFNEWDIIEEEFLKSTTKSSLKLKLNLSKVNEICKLVKSKRNIPNLDVQDELLVQSDVFDYAFHDTQFVSDPSKVPSRVIELSRRMDVVRTKKFPNVEIKKDGYIIKTYGPQDRRLLSAGYRSHCCFRARGNADNGGNDNSLLNYCTSTEYGGGVEIFDSKGETIMFSPLLRNGNVLMIHSVETSLQHNLPSECYQLLVEYAQEAINKATEANDDISFVTIANLHYLDESFTKGQLPSDKKFFINDPEKKFDGMYTNLAGSHMILANREGKKTDDIVYGEVSVDYEFDVPKVFGIVDVTEQEKQYIYELDILRGEYIDVANKRSEAMKQGDEKESYTLLAQLKDKKSEYLKKYKELVKIHPSSDIYLDYKKAVRYIGSINEKLGISVDEKEILEVTYSTNWYIIITKDNRLIANALESGKEDMLAHLNKIKEVRSFSNVVSSIEQSNMESEIFEKGKGV